MRSLSISDAWDETKAVLAREGRLLVPVALAMVALPSILSTVIDPRQDPENAVVTILLIALMLLGMVGQLALIRLAIGPSISVGEAIAHALRRALPFLGAFLMLLAAIALLAIPLIIVMALVLAITNPEMAASGDPAQLIKSPAFGLFIILFLLGACYVFVRTMLLSPVASAEPIGPVAILRRSLELTRGRFWRLFSFLLLSGLAYGISVYAAEALAGLIAQSAFGKLEPFSGSALFVGIVSGTLTALLTTVVAVMLARIYLQLAGRGEAEVSVPSSAG